MTAARSAVRRRRWEAISGLISSNIRDARLSLDLTQAECANLLGTSSAYWRSLESGHKSMSLLRAVEVADVLGITIAQLMAGV